MSYKPGLRFKIIATLVTLLSLLSAAAGLLLTSQLRAEALHYERIAATQDMRRLMLSLDQQLDEVDVILGSWANYTSLYQHAAKPDPVFRRDELNANALRVAHFDWLVLFDARGQLAELSEVPLASGERPFNTVVNDPAFAQRKARVIEHIRTVERDCSPIALMDRIGMSCFRPLHTTDSQGPPHGKVMIGRWLSTAAIESVRKETGLEFDIAIAPARVPHAAEPAGADAIVGKLGRGVPRFETRPEQLRVSLPLLNAFDEEIGSITMLSPRASLQRESAANARLVRTLIYAIVVTAILLIFIIDRIVVRRLRHFHDKEVAIVHNERWDDTIDVHGSDEIGRLATVTNAMLGVIRRQLAALSELALTDTLTRLANRRRFDEALAVMLRGFQRDRQTGALVLFDIDHFKRYNDLYGHPAGDAVLVRFASSLQAYARRPNDLAARLGGEEFALLMPRCDEAGALACADAVCQTLSAIAITHAGNGDAGIVTVSAGVAMMAAGDSLESLYARADAALYAAKHGGRNRVACAPVDAPIASPQ